LFPEAADVVELADCGDIGIFVFRHGFSESDKIPFRNWSVPLTLSAMDLGMSSGWAVFFVAEFCGVPDFPAAKRAIPHMTRRVATRKRLILASGVQKGYVTRRGKSNVRAHRVEVNCARWHGRMRLSATTATFFKAGSWGKFSIGVSELVRGGPRLRTPGVGGCRTVRDYWEETGEDQ